MPPAVKPIEKLRPPIASMRRSRIARSVSSSGGRVRRRAPISGTVQRGACERDDHGDAGDAERPLLADQIREQAADREPDRHADHDRGAHDARRCCRPAHGPAAWSASACAETNTHAEPTPWSSRPARKHAPGCPVTMPSSRARSRRSGSRAPTSIVRRLPNRSAIIPISGTGDDAHRAVRRENHPDERERQPDPQSDDRKDREDDASRDPGEQRARREGQRQRARAYHARRIAPKIGRARLPGPVCST